MTLKLCGFSASNYYNQVKLQLLEKQLPFEEEMVLTGGGARLLGGSPMGKVPFLDTGEGCVSESIACSEYIEAAFPQPSLLPSDAFGAAKVRELVLYVELHLELVARPLYPEAFFGAKVSDETKDRSRKLLVKGATGLGAIARFDPFLAGGQFTLADCAGIVHLPLVSSASKAIYGEDLLADLPVKAYMQICAGRPAVKKVNDDRKLDTQRMLTASTAKS